MYMQSCATYILIVVKYHGMYFIKTIALHSIQRENLYRENDEQIQATYPAASDNSGSSTFVSLRKTEKFSFTVKR